MAIGWGTFGVLWRDEVVSVYVKPNRYTYGFMNQSNRFSLCWFDDGHDEIINVCGKQSGRDIDKDQACNLTPMLLDDTVCYKEAKLVITCEKVYEEQLKKDFIKNQMALDRYYQDEPVHKVYYGKILGVYTKH